MNIATTRRHLLAAAGLGAVASAWAQGAPYPNKLVRVIVPFPPGGATDIVAREIGERLAAALGQPFVVDNKSGASGNLGIEMAVRAPADGYTLVIGAPQTLVINPQLFKNLSFNPQRDLAPIAVIASVPNVLLVSPKLAARTPQELVAYAKANPGRLNYGSSSIGGTPHLSAELFKSMTGAYVVHIPYRGSAPALQDLIGGQIDMMFDNLPAALPHIKSGRVKVLAVASRKRSAMLPDVPAAAEAGLPNYEAYSWTALFAPAKTPQAVLDKINADFNTAFKDPAVRQRLLDGGAETAPGTQQEMRDFLRAEIAKWAKVIKTAGITTG